MKKIRTISMLIALIFLSTALMAGCTHRTHRWGHEKAAGHITKALSLNEDQKAELDVLMKQIKSSRLELCSSRRVIDAEFKKQLQNDSLNAEGLNSLIAEELGRVEASVGSIVVQVADFHSTLTADQKEKLLDHLNEGEGKWHRRHHKSICDEVEG
jgi:hypothetical protein